MVERSLAKDTSVLRQQPSILSDSGPHTCESSTHNYSPTASHSSSSSSQGSVTSLAYLAKEILLSAIEPILITLTIAGVNEECEAIRAFGSLKVNNLYMESALCKVNHSRFTEIFITDSSNDQRKLRKRTYIADFTTATKHIGAVLELPDVAEIPSPTMSRMPEKLGK